MTTDNSFADESGNLHTNQIAADMGGGAGLQKGHSEVSPADGITYYSKLNDAGRMADVFAHKPTNVHSSETYLHSLPLAVPPDPGPPVALGVEARSIAECLTSGEVPVGPLLRGCQGYSDLTLVGNHVHRLAGRMAGSNRRLDQLELQEAIAAGVYALAVWRATGKGCDGQPEILATRVAWRAVMRSLAHDWLTESIPLSALADDWLWKNTGQHEESRAERAARLKVERAALDRKQRLKRRLDGIPAGRGRRAQVIGKLRTAAMALLDGVNLDEAAKLAGFKAHGRNKASAHLLTACLRLGLIAQPRRREGSASCSPARLGEVITDEARRLAAARRLGLRRPVPVRLGKFWLLADGAISCAAPWARS